MIFDLCKLILLQPQYETINDVTGSVLVHTEFAMHSGQLLVSGKRPLDAYGVLHTFHKK